MKTKALVWNELDILNPTANLPQPVKLCLIYTPTGFYLARLQENDNVFKNDTRKGDITDIIPIEQVLEWTYID